MPIFSSLQPEVACLAAHLKHPQTFNDASPSSSSKDTLIPISNILHPCCTRVLANDIEHLDLRAIAHVLDA